MSQAAATDQTSGHTHDLYQTVATLAGWLVMISAISQLALRSGAVVHFEFVTAATFLSLICICFLFLLRPQLGSWHELTGVVSTFVIFITLLIGFTHVLANQGGWPLARLLSWFQSLLHQMVAWAGGEGLAEFTTSPLYLLCAFVLLISFAYKSYLGFLAFIGAFLLYGLYPWDLGIVTAYLLWIAGFALLQRETLYLPRAIEERLHLDPGARDLLLEIRQRPLTDHEVRFYLEGATAAQSTQLTPASRTTLTRLGEAGLLEYNADAGKICAGHVLNQSYLPRPVAAFVEAASWIASWILLGIAGIYFMIPVDFLPEILLGPLGFFDDILLTALASLPVGTKLLGVFRASLLARTVKK
ncbi:MAG: DUF1232 domain-containing protein [Candidatus Hydrogenedentes bacterium]|nr:DUF1232 domain-containing protein [Candidatus Hydrogenedentota bacterium]